MPDHSFGAKFKFFFHQDGDRLFHNAEVAPPASPADGESQLSVLTASPGERIIHCNTYLRLKLEQKQGIMADNSRTRMDTLTSKPKPKDRYEVARILGDQTGDRFWIFQDYPSHYDAAKTSITIAVGTTIFYG